MPDEEERPLTKALLVIAITLAFMMVLYWVKVYG